MKQLIFFFLLLMGTSALQASKEQNNADIRDIDRPFRHAC